MARRSVFEYLISLFVISCAAMFFWAASATAASPTPPVSETYEEEDPTHGGPAETTLGDLDFVLPNLSGETVVLSRLLAKGPVLLAFFATWCPPCVDEIPDLNAIQESFSSKGLTVVGVDIGESQLKVSKFAERHGIRYPVVLDRESEVADQYAVLGIPTSILIDQEGRVRFRGFGLPSEWVLAELTGPPSAA